MSSHRAVAIQPAIQPTYPLPPPPQQSQQSQQPQSSQQSSQQQQQFQSQPQPQSQQQQQQHHYQHSAHHQQQQQHQPQAELGAEEQALQELKHDHHNHDSDEQIYELPLPPIATYENRAEMENAAKSFGGAHGYDLSVRKTWSKEGRVVKIRLGCTRGRVRTKVEDKDRKRLNTPRQTIDCKMFLHGAAADRKVPDGPWRLYYGELPGSRVHNHPAAEHRSALPGQRRMARTQGVTDIIRHHLEIGDSVAKTHTAVKRFLSDANEDEGMITATDIANERKRVKREELGHMTLRDHMLNAYVEKGFFVRWQLDNDGNLDRLFVAGPRQLKLFAQHPDIVLSDCTFSNNRNNMPVQQFFGVAGSGDTFCIGVCFLNGEGQEDFSWSIRQLQDLMTDSANAIASPYCIVSDRCLANVAALDSVFTETPNIFCRWQMRQEIEGWARRNLSAGSESTPSRGKAQSEQIAQFYDLVMTSFNATSESDFYEAVEDIRQQHPAAATYLEEDWWCHKERCVTAFAPNLMHFDHTIATRQDGQHIQLKKWIQHANGDLLAVVKSAEPYWDQQADKIRTRLAQAKSQTTIVLQQPFYKATARIIHREVLNKVEESRKAAKTRKDPLPACTHLYRTMTGRPCRHELQDLESKSGRMLLPTDFHAHWWIDRTQAQKHSGNPRVFPSVQEPRRSTIVAEEPASPTEQRRSEPQQLPSQFERLEAATRELPATTASRAAPAAQMTSSQMTPSSPYLQSGTSAQNLYNDTSNTQQSYSTYAQSAAAQATYQAQQQQAQQHQGNQQQYGQHQAQPSHQQSSQVANQLVNGGQGQYNPLQPYNQEHYGYEPAWMPGNNSGRR